MTSNFLNINNFKLHYEVYEGLVDQDTLLIHGNLACNIWWHPMVDVLKSKSTSKKGKLVMADWRGCGLSKGLQSEDEINFDVFADDYLHLIEALNLKNISVIGHSTGGLIGMLAILKQPHNFSSLILLDSIGPLGIETPIPLDQLLGHFEAMSKSEELSNMTIAATIQNVDPTTDYFKSLAKATFNVDKAVWRGVPQELCTNIDIRDRMQELDLPTLILHGENDLVLPLGGSETMHKMIKDSELKILKNQGHSFNVEDPKAFVEAIESFWSRIN
jgi:pimeloyl-ACP methyl ester carboxylesterase